MYKEEVKRLGSSKVLSTGRINIFIVAHRASNDSRSERIKSLKKGKIKDTSHFMAVTVTNKLGEFTPCSLLWLF